MNNMIFVFGSNLAGIHGAGAAQRAVFNHGAVWGHGIGLRGESYAIPTKDMYINTLPKDSVRHYIDEFIHFAEGNPKMKFKVTRIGCGLAGFNDEEIAPLFVNAGQNCWFDTAWRQWLPGKQFWGTF